jgi:hypothetical protein
LKALFENAYYLQGENLRYLIVRQQRWCIVSFLEGVAFEFGCCLGGDCIVVASARMVWRDFYFIVLFLFLLCASVLLLVYCIVTEGGYFWY